MASNDGANVRQEKAPELPQLEVKRMDNDNKNATYSFRDEDHTLGNLLRNQIIKSNVVEFCAYSVPHPSEPIMNVRIQCHEGTDTDTKKVLNHGLKRVSKMCDAIKEKFNAKLAAFEAESDM